jgi:hypothetical protein
MTTRTASTTSPGAEGRRRLRPRYAGTAPAPTEAIARHHRRAADEIWVLMQYKNLEEYTA